MSSLYIIQKKLKKLIKNSTNMKQAKRLVMQIYA